ncbi:MAG: hypothetical protein FWH03_03250 [Firmicutes bacterium]|nr:hypothetical protein [Bacillota bacterium]
MEYNQFSAIIRALVPKVVEAYMLQTDSSYETALRLLYQSKLYTALEAQDTALWQLSPLALCDMLTEEIKTGKVDLGGV